MRRRKREHRPLPEPHNQVAHVESLIDEAEDFDADEEVRRMQMATASRAYALRRAD